MPSVNIGTSQGDKKTAMPTNEDGRYSCPPNSSWAGASDGHCKSWPPDARPTLPHPYYRAWASDTSELVGLGRGAARASGARRPGVVMVALTRCELLHPTAREAGGQRSSVSARVE